MSCKSCKTGGQVPTGFVFVPTSTGTATRKHRAVKGAPSKTHLGRKDYTTKMGDKVFHRMGHDVKLKRKPYSKKKGGASEHPPVPPALKEWGKKVAMGGLKDIATKAALVGAPILAHKVYKRVRKSK